MNIVHCDICREEVGDRGNIWANMLPSTDPLRRVSAQITFSTEKKPIDLCDTCMEKFLRGVRGVGVPHEAQ